MCHTFHLWLKWKKGVVEKKDILKRSPYVWIIKVTIQIFFFFLRFLERAWKKRSTFILYTAIKCIYQNICWAEFVKHSSRGPSDYERQSLFLIKVPTERGQVVILITRTNGTRVTLEATQAFYLISLVALLMGYCCTNKHDNACAQWMNE